VVSGLVGTVIKDLILLAPYISRFGLCNN